MRCISIPVKNWCDAQGEKAIAKSNFSKHKKCCLLSSSSFNINVVMQVNDCVPWIIYILFDLVSIDDGYLIAG